MTLDEAIFKFTSEREVKDQAALMELLKHAGHPVTQPTLSRHLLKLGIQKVAGRYQKVDNSPAELPGFTLTPAPPNLLVIRTRPGYAQPLAVQLDQQKPKGVAGTLAGDDTVFIAVAPPSRLRVVAAAVRQLLAGNVTDSATGAATRVTFAGRVLTQAPRVRR
ncbi:MAG: arginine repressor [Gammaproteobacteria bacterium]